ncbi:glycosyltransferase [Paracoccaceae bacterium]|nr:glycosyltransferase [Paracoccaceae bacterium]
MPAYSIVSVIFNDIEALRKFYKTLKIFEDDFELILVFNPGVLSVRDYAIKLSVEDARVCVIDNDINIGLAAANQQGIERAIGDYIYVVNPDVFWIMPVLNSLRLRFEMGDVSFVSPLNLDENGVSHCHWHSNWGLWHMLFYRTIPLRLIEAIKSVLFDYDIERRVGYVSGSTIFSSRSLFSEIGYDPNMFLSVEDVADLCDRARTYTGKPSLVFPEVCTVHVGGTSHESNKWIAWIFAARGGGFYLKKRDFRVAAFIHRVFMCVITALKQSLLTRRPMLKPIKTMWHLSNLEMSDQDVVRYMKENSL